MPMNHQFAAQEPDRTEVDTLRGPVLVEFGAPWCPHCQRAQPLLEEALAGHEGIQHIKIEDGAGKRLGRTFGVKLWPTLVFMKDGQEVSRLVRPTTQQPVTQAAAQVD